MKAEELVGDRRSRALALYQMGHNARATAAEVDAGYGAVRRALKSVGLLRGHGGNRTLTDDQISRAVVLYRDGVRVVDILAETGVGAADTLLRHVDIAGIPRRRPAAGGPRPGQRRLTPAGDADRAVTLYREGMPVAKILTETGIGSAATVLRYVDKAGVPRRGR